MFNFIEDRKLIIYLSIGKIDFVDIIDFVDKIKIQKINTNNGSYAKFVSPRFNFVFNKDYVDDERLFIKKQIKLKRISKYSTFFGISDKLDEVYLKAFISEELLKLIKKRKIDLKIKNLDVYNLENLAVEINEVYGEAKNAFLIKNKSGNLLILANPEDFEILISEKDEHLIGGLICKYPERIKICSFETFNFKKDL